MIDYPGMLVELEQLTAALEAALSHQEWEQAEGIMAQRLILLRLLGSEQPEDPQMRLQLKEAAVRITRQEQEMVRLMQSEQHQILEKLRVLIAGNKVTQLYQQNR